MLVDTHAHLEMTQFDGDREAVLERARAEGLLYIISVGSDLDGSRGAVQLARTHDFVHAAVGIHPHEVKDITEATYDELRELAKDPKVVAWGEDRAAAIAHRAHFFLQCGDLFDREAPPPAEAPQPIHTISLFVNNKPGVLVRVALVFTLLSIAFIGTLCSHMDEEPNASH